MSLILKSREQLAGDIVRALVSQTDITDVSVGSSLAILIESIASVQFQIQMKIMKILESSNIESLVGVALDNKARSLGLPNGIGGFGRRPATKSSGNVTIGSSFQKISTKSYAGKPSPYAGSTTLYVENASSFPPTGKLYIGRGTADRFEGPIAYTSVTNNLSYWTVALSSPMTKSHIYSDLVTVAQGGDRNINVGQAVSTAASNGNPSVSFTSLSTVILPDGESSTSVPVSCSQYGRLGNVLAGSISQFGTAPFSGATVTNPADFVNGQSSENDADLRKRIKDFPSLLSKGTVRAIEAAIQGASDPATGKTILSTSVHEATVVGEVSDVFIDDGTGLEPTFLPQPYELLLESALGIENNLELSQTPVTACIAVGVNEAPFILSDGTSVGTPIDYIQVIVDGVSESYTITPSNYASLQAATCYELVRDFNANTNNNRTAWRTIKGGTGLVCFDQSGTAGLMQIQSSPLQEKLGLPTSELRPLYLYENGVLLSGAGLTASITTGSQASWTALVGVTSFTAKLLVGQVVETATIQDSDFSPYHTTIATATLDNWISVLKTKFAGVSFSILDTNGVQQLVFTSQNANSDESVLEVVVAGSSPCWASTGGILDPAVIKQLNVGRSKDYNFNRMTGDVEFINSPAVGSRIEAGTRNTRAAIESVPTSTGKYSLTSLSPGVGLPQMVVSFDDLSAAAIATPATNPGDTATITLRSDNMVTMTFSNAIFYAGFLANGLKVGSYFLLVMDSSVGPSWGNVGGIYRVKVKNDTLYAISFEVSPNQMAAFTSIFTIPQFIAPTMILAFNCDDSLPQLVSFVSGDLGSPTIDQLVSTISGQLFGGTAEKLSASQFVIRSNRYNDSLGARVCSILAVSGSIGAIFSTGVSSGIQAHVASSESLEAGGAAPVISAISTADVFSSGHAWRSFLKARRVMTDVTNLSASPITITDYQSSTDRYPKGCQHLWTSGRNVGFEGRCYNIGTSGGFDGIMSAKGVTPIFETSSNQASGTGLDDYRNFGVRVQDLGVSATDKLVVVLDQNAQDKTISVAMGKKAIIQDINAIPSDGQPQSIHFRLQDPDDSNRAFFDNTSIFKNFDFSDFNMMTKSIGIVRNFSSYADIARANVAFLPYSSVNGIQIGDYLTINDGLSDIAKFTVAAHSAIAVNWTAGSSTLSAGSAVTAGQTVTFFNTSVGNTFPNEISANQVLFALTSGTSFTVGYSYPGTAITMHSSAVSGVMEAIAITSAVPNAAVRMPVFQYASGSVETLPVYNPALPVLSVSSVSGQTIAFVHNHGLVSGDTIVFASTTPITGITNGQLYWVYDAPLANTVRLSASFPNISANIIIGGLSGGSGITVKPSGIWQGETVTLNDGINGSVLFEFDSTGIVPVGVQRVALGEGTAATGSVTISNPSNTSLLGNSQSTAAPQISASGLVYFPSHGVLAGDYISLGSWADDPLITALGYSGHSIYYVVSKTDANNFVIRASISSGAFSGSNSYVATTLSAPWTMFKVNPIQTYPMHDDVFTISNGVTSQNFRVWMSSASTSLYMSATEIPIIAPSGLPCTAFSWTGNTGTTVAAAMATAINGATWFNMTATPSSNVCNLVCNKNGTLSTAITAALTPIEVIYPRSSYNPYSLSGMSGGSAADTAEVLTTKLITAINALAPTALYITAAAGTTLRDTALTNDNPGVAGNQLITSANPSGLSYLPKVGMAGGVNAPSVTQIRDSFLSAIGQVVALGSLQVEAFSSGTTSIDLLGSIAGSYTVAAYTTAPGVYSLLSGSSLTVTSTPGTTQGALSSNALVVRSVKFGCPSRLAVSIQYPALPNQANVVVSHLNTFDSSSYSPSQLCTFTAPSTINCSNHGLVVGDRVIFVSSLTLPLGLNENQIYYVESVPLSGTFTVTASSVDASLAPAVVFSGAGTGTTSFVRINEEFSAKTTLNILLKSGAAAGGALLNSGIFTVATRTVDQYTRRLTFTSASLNQNLSYTVGNILTVGGSSSDISGSYLITFADTGVVEVMAPGSTRSISGTYQAATYPINTFPLVATYLTDVATAISAYNPNNPIATAQAIGSGASAEAITLATYITNTQEYQGFDADMSDAINNHSFPCKLAGIANIYQYDPSDPSLNNIIALVQSHNSIFPNANDTAGLTYSIVGEEVYLVPTNKVTSSRWLNFVVSSSLPILSKIENVGIGGAKVQIASDSDGSLGAVKISTSGANQASSFLINNSSDIGDSTRSYILSATADTFVRDNLVLVQNSLTSDIARSYAVAWAGTGTAPLIEQQTLTDYFRPANAIKYEQVTLDTARLYFYRTDMVSTPTLSGGTVSITKVDVGLYDLKVVSGGGTFSARTGDICLFSPASAFVSQWKFASAQVASKVYPGHQVVAVISSTEILISVIDDDGSYAIASPVTISSSSDLTFAPAIWNEKNIYTNKKGGTEFATNGTLGNACWISYKKIGDNFLSVWLKNSATELTDDMRLNSALVCTDDFVYLPGDATPHRLVAHNGRNNLIIYDPNGVDSLMDVVAHGSETGTDYWLVKYTGVPGTGINIGTTDDRAIRILDGSSVKFNDSLRISTSVVVGNTWFSSGMLGNWTITDIGWSQKVQGYMTITLTATPSITNGSYFTISDGSPLDPGTITFEFNSSLSGVTAGHVWIDTSVNTGVAIAQKIVAAVNLLSGSTFFRASYAGISSAVVTLTNTTLGVTGTLNHVTAGTEPTYDGSHLNQGLTNDAAQMMPYVTVNMTKCPRFVYDSTGTPVDHFSIGGNSGAIGFVEGTPLSVVRVVGGTAVDPLNVENSEIFLAPKRQSNKMTSSYGTELIAFNKFGFANSTNVGIDGYVSFSGLIAQAHKIIDGSPLDQVTYPGVRAAGTQIEVLPALIKSVQVSLVVATKDGVSLGSLTDSIKSTVSGYINGLGVGSPVIMSSMISVVQAIPGVNSVRITNTLPATDAGDASKISVSENERAFVLNSNSDITVG